MKANEAPENIYLALNMFGDIIKDQWQFHRLRDDDIEYTRTDAFIDKADKFISSFFHPDDTELKKVALDEFHKYMKGE